MQVIAIAMLLFAAFLTCSNCDLEVQTSLTGSEVDESHDILLYSGDDQGPVVDSQGGGALLHNGGGPDKQDYVDMEPMLDPEADFGKSTFLNSLIRERCFVHCLLLS